MKTHGEIEAAICEGINRFVTNVKVISMHHDISTVTGEKVVVFTLAETPKFREMKKKSSV